MTSLWNKDRILSCLLMIVLAASMLKSADEDSNVMGTVIDQSGGPIPGALIEIASAQTGANGPIIASAKADKKGRFKIEHIHVSAFSMKVTAKGFKPTITKGETANRREIDIGAVTLKTDCSTPGVICDQVTPKP